MAGPSVGIVTRTRDRGVFLRRALAAVLDQSFGDWRLVVVNDGGDPEALRRAIAPLAGRFQPGALMLIDNPVSRGRAAAFNQGLAALDSRLVACLDDDDTWDPAFLEALVAFHDETAALVPDLGGVAARVTALREDLATGPDGEPIIVPLGEDGLPPSFHRREFLLGPIAYATYRQDLYPVQWLIDRAAALAVGGFPECFEVMEDRAFLLRLLEHRRIAILDRPLAYHHRRVKRVADGQRSAELNTLDNPSYDWQRFSDLALPSLATPADAPEAALAALVRGVGAAVLREVTAETGALWHKLDAEARGLRERIEAVEARLGGRVPPPEGTGAGGALWSLWEAVGPAEIGYALEVGVAFLGRLVLAHRPPTPEPVEGLLLHAAPWRREAILQVPQTGGWCALELDLAGLAPPDRGLWVEFAAGLAGGGLLQSAVARRDAKGRGFELAEAHVHAAPGAGGVRIRRHLAPALLDPARRPRFSIVLPRHAANLRLHLHDLVVAPD